MDVMGIAENELTGQNFWQDLLPLCSLYTAYLAHGMPRFLKVQPRKVLGTTKAEHWHEIHHSYVPLDYSTVLGAAGNHQAALGFLS